MKLFIPIQSFSSYEKYAFGILLQISASCFNLLPRGLYQLSCYLRVHIQLEISRLHYHNIHMVLRHQTDAKV